MGRQKDLSMTERGKIEFLGKLGYSQRKIATELGRNQNSIGSYLSDPKIRGKTYF
jgi:IS30 family transposase